MDIVKFLSNQSRKFSKGYARVTKRNAAWIKFEQLARTRFNSIAQEAPTQKLFEFLYVKNNKQNNVKTKYLTFFFGQHPIGYDHTKDNNTLASEGGCALHYSQGPKGDVICLIYPFSSNLISPNIKHYIYTIYSSPEDITEKEIYHHVNLLFSVAHHSSCYGAMGVTDWLNMFEIRLNMLWIKLQAPDPIDYVLAAFEFAAKQIKKSN